MKRDLEATLATRDSCWRCLRASAGCFCARLNPFDSEPEIVILMHPRETRKRIGTARMAHLSMSNSRLFRGEGTDFDRDPRLRALAAESDRRSFVLFPGPDSIDLDVGRERLDDLCGGRPLRIFVIDGTWSEARKMIARSELLMGLPRLMFQPTRPSNYRIRRQPKPVCVSTVEAIHALLEKTVERGLGRLPPGRAHDRMLEIFDEMVDRQIAYRDGLISTVT